jgi:Mg-chelatase subunit ChlD
MKKTNTDITFILDRSGSMGSIRNRTIEGFNTFLEEQQEGNPGALLTLIQFDHEYEIVFSGKKTGEVVPLNRDTYVPRGMTALLDAIGRGIRETRARHKAMKKKKRPEKVVFAILTDGLENASREYSRDKIFRMIRKREEKDGWQFLFLGAHQDAIHEAATLGIHAKMAMRFAADDRGTIHAFRSVSKNISNFALEDDDLAFTEEQRKEQER